MNKMSFTKIDLKKFFKDFDLVFRSQTNKENWDFQINENISFFPYEFSYNSISYQIEYQNLHYDYIQDLSFIIYLENNPICFFYFSHLEKNGFKYLISLNGPFANSICLPIFSKFVSKKIKNKIFDNFHALIRHLKNLNFREINFRESQCEKKSISVFSHNLLNYNHNINILFINYLNISDDIQYKLNLRKSYKSLINSTLKNLSFSIIESDCEELYKIKKLHFEISGLKTRSDKTWEIQFNEIINGNGFLVNLYQNNNLCSSSMFLFTRDEVIYASGVYKNIKGLSLGHASQDIAIRKMLTLKKKWYRLGEMPFSFYKMKHHTEKLINISKFKNGFSSDLIPTYIYSE